MTDRKKALEALLEKVKAGTAGPEDFDWTKDHWPKDLPSAPSAAAYTGSLDRAIALHEVKLPNYSYLLGHVKTGRPGAVIYADPSTDLDEAGYVEAETPARALFICDLRALIEQEETE